MNNETSSKEFEYFSDTDVDRIRNNFMIPIIDDIIRRYPSHNILDYGCGNGLFGAYFKEKTKCSLTGADGSSYALKKASEQGYDKTVLISDFSTMNLPFENSTFDLVICKDILEHLLNPHKVIQESHRVLCTNGNLLVHVPNHFPLIDRIKFLFNKNIDTQNYFPEADNWNYPHIRFYTFDGLLKNLKQKGFKVIQNYSFHFARLGGFISRVPFGTILGRTLARWSPDNFSAGFTLLLKKR